MGIVKKLKTDPAFTQGLPCPVCGHPGTKVCDSRLLTDPDYIRRRRECLSCTHRFTTNEVTLEQGEQLRRILSKLTAIKGIVNS